MPSHLKGDYMGGYFGVLGVIICLLAADVWCGTLYPLPALLSVMAAIICFLSWGIMHTTSMRSVKTRWIRVMSTDDPFRNNDHSDQESISIAQANSSNKAAWLSTTNILFTIVGFCLLILGLIERFS